MEGDHVSAIERLILCLTCGRPRNVPCLSHTQFACIFTDGASEGDDHTVGGVLVFRGSSKVMYFACKLTRLVVASWLHRATLEASFSVTFFCAKETGSFLGTHGHGSLAYPLSPFALMFPGLR